MKGILDVHISLELNLMVERTGGADTRAVIPPYQNDDHPHVAS